MRRALSLGFAVLVGLLVWFLPEPAGVKERGWELLAIFVSTMVGVILKPFPMGMVSIFALMVVTVTRTLTFEEAFSGFGNDVVWLIVFAFFIARGFISTGLGSRVAYKIMSFYCNHIFRHFLCSRKKQLTSLPQHLEFFIF